MVLILGGMRMSKTANVLKDCAEDEGRVATVARNLENLPSGVTPPVLGSRYKFINRIPLPTLASVPLIFTELSSQDPKIPKLLTVDYIRNTLKFYPLFTQTKMEIFYSTLSERKLLTRYIPTPW